MNTRKTSKHCKYGVSEVGGVLEVIRTYPIIIRSWKNESGIRIMVFNDSLT
jgi:hypothetical protein